MPSSLAATLQFGHCFMSSLPSLTYTFYLPLLLLLTPRLLIPNDPSASALPFKKEPRQAGCLRETDRSIRGFWNSGYSRPSPSAADVARSAKEALFCFKRSNELYSCQQRWKIFTGSDTTVGARKGKKKKSPFPKKLILLYRSTNALYLRIKN